MQDEFLGLGEWQSPKWSLVLARSGMLTAGLRNFYYRKPELSTKDCEAFFNDLWPAERRKVVIHWSSGIYLRRPLQTLLCTALGSQSQHRLGLLGGHCRQQPSRSAGAPHHCESPPACGGYEELPSSSSGTPAAAFPPRWPLFHNPQRRGRLAGWKTPCQRSAVWRWSYPASNQQVVLTSKAHLWLSFKHECVTTNPWGLGRIMQSLYLASMCSSAVTGSWCRLQFFQLNDRASTVAWSNW